MDARTLSCTPSPSLQTHTFKSPVEVTSASFWAWMGGLDTAAETAKHVAAGFYNHSFMPTGKTSNVTCVWESKFELDAGDLQKYLDGWNGFCFNNDVKR